MITNDTILALIEEVYDRKYIDYLKITPISPVGTSVRLGLSHNANPIHIAAELEDDKFLKFFKQELRCRHLHTNRWYDGYRVINKPNLETRCPTKS